MSRRASLLVGFVASALAVGIPYWLIPYNKVDLPNALIGPGLAVLTFVALWMCARRVAPLWLAVGALGASVPAAVLARMVIDCLMDPTSHNLWPFEVIIASFVGFVSALVGAAAGSLVGMLGKGKAQS